MRMTKLLAGLSNCEQAGFGEVYFGYKNLASPRLIHDGDNRYPDVCYKRSDFASYGTSLRASLGDFMKKLLATKNDLGIFVVRLMLGVVFFPHGAQKMLGWFGGYGFSGTMGFFTEKAGLPAALAFLVILGEFAGSLGLIVGFLSRIAAFGILCIMLGAIFTVHLPNGFFMNWYGTNAGEGFEYHLLAIGMALCILISGGGAYSLDRQLTQNSNA